MRSKRRSLTTTTRTNRSLHFNNIHISKRQEKITRHQSLLKSPLPRQHLKTIPLKLFIKLLLCLILKRLPLANILKTITIHCLQSTMSNLHWTTRSDDHFRLMSTNLQTCSKATGMRRKTCLVNYRMLADRFPCSHDPRVIVPWKMLQLLQRFQTRQAPIN